MTKEKSAGEILAEALKAGTKPDVEAMRKAMEKQLPPGCKLSMSIEQK